MIKILCVDNEKSALQRLVLLCKEMEAVSDVQGFDLAGEALRWIRDHSCDLVLMRAGFPHADGITFAQRIREIRPRAEIVFIADDDRYAMDAWSVHARGYLIRPVTTDRLKAEVDYVLTLHPELTAAPPAAHIEVRTFGSFDVMVDGEPVHFHRSKAKELLAYLVEKQGQSITREEAFGILWEGKPYDRSGQKQMDVIFRSLRKTLNEYGISGILSFQRGAICIIPRQISCDMYRFVLGDPAAISEYRGEYMTAYSWASLREAYLERRIENLT